jgi:hypothetical protein
LDRGIKKWNMAGFMPLHKKLLHEMYYEDLKVAMPILDEYEILAINEKISNSFENRLPINLKLYYDGFKEWIGPVIIKKFDPLNKEIKIELSDNTLKTINLENLVGVEYE